jgi:two-component system LytT family response regulator
MKEDRLSVVIVDDVALARQRMRRLLEKYPDIRIVGACADAESAVTTIAEERPDLILLDVDMPESNGFDLLGRLGEGFDPAVVFTTAHQQFAAQAFRVKALDYLLKPILETQLREALDRAWGKKRGVRCGPSYLILREREQTRIIPMAEIDWVEAAGNYACIRVGKETFIHRETLTRLENKLDPSLFQRVHRSRIVNVHRVSKMVPLFNGDNVLILLDGTELTSSRSWREALLARLVDQNR